MPTRAPPSTPSTWSTWITTCSSPGTHRKRSSIRCSMTFSRRGTPPTIEPSTDTKVVGHRWSARSSDVREFLGRNQVPYRWYQSEDPEGQRLLAAAGVDGCSPACRHHPRRRGARRAHGRAVGGARRARDHAVRAVLRPRGHRRRPGGSGAALYGASEGLRTVF